MLEFILFIAVIVIFVKYNSIEKRIKRLEGDPLKQSPQVSPENLDTPPPVKNTGMADNQVMPETAPQSTENVPITADSQSEDHTQQLDLSAMVDWLRKDWLMKLGALLLLIGFGWLVTYAFANNWIGPMGRITLGIIAGTAILILGTWRIRTRLHQGMIFTILGSTVILLTVFAARELYDLFTPFSALAIMFLSTAYVAFVSVKFRARSLAIIALVLAAIAPNLVGSGGSPEYVTIFSYLSIIILGAIWVVVITGWRSLTLLALVIVGGYSAPVLIDGSVIEKDTILLFAYGFSALFFIFNTVGLLRVQDKSIKADIYTAAGNGIFLLAWILSAADKDWQSLIIVAWMLVFSIGAFIIYRHTKQKFAFFIYAGVSIGMLAAATAAELNGAALTIAYIIETVAISLVAFAALKDSNIGQKLSLLIVGPIVLTFGHIYQFERSSTVFNEYFFTILILAMGLLMMGLFYKYFSQTYEKEKSNSKFYIVHLIIGSIYLYVLLWFSLQNGLENSSVAAMIALTIFTIIGLGTNIYGKFKESKIFGFYGGSMLAFVIIRLFMVDVWQMELTSRIITFFLIGMLLMSTAFINKKKQLIQ